MRRMTDGERELWNEMQADAMPEVRELGRRKLRARVRHVCTTCRKPIQPGEQYLRVALVEDGRFEELKFCGPCWWVGA